MVEKHPRSNSGNGRPSITFGEGTVRNFYHGSLAANGVNSVLPAPGEVAKEMPGNWNTILARGITKRPSGKKQSQPNVPPIPKNNRRRNLLPLEDEDMENVSDPSLAAGVAVATPLGPAVPSSTEVKTPPTEVSGLPTRTLTVLPRLQNLRSEGSSISYPVVVGASPSSLWSRPRGGRRRSRKRSTRKRLTRKRS